MTLLLPRYAHFPVNLATVTEMSRRHWDFALVLSPVTLLMKSSALGPSLPVVSTTNGMMSFSDISGS